MNQQQQQMMSSYEQPSTPLLPEKLPGIDKLPISNNNTESPVSSPPVPTSMIDNRATNGYLPPPSIINQQQQFYSNNNANNTGLIYHQHMSPPLTPAVSPSSVLLDSMQFKRKFSVDVGPFGFGTNIPHPSATAATMHDGSDAYRRSSCSAVSLDQQQQQQDYHHFLNVHQQYATDHTMLQQHQHQHQPQQQTASTSNKRRNSRSQLSGPNTQHKHACKYPYCSWSFKRYEHLKRHMLVHTGKRPHVCHFPGCGKSFSRSDNFHAHYRTHTKKSNLMNGATGTTTTKRKNSNANNNTTTNAATMNASATAAAAAVAASAAAAVAASNTSFVDDNRTPAYFAKQQSFDMTNYQDMYSHRHSYSEGSDDFHHNEHYLRNTFHQPHFTLQQPSAAAIHSPESVATTSTSTTTTTAGVPSLLNHELNNQPFYSEDNRFNYHPNNNMIHYRDTYGYHPYPTTTTTADNSSSIAAAVAVVAAAASSSTATSNSRRSSSTTTTNSSSTATLQQQQQKSHICPVSQCQRRFKRLEHLKRHMRIHTLERPFGCSFPNCHKTFSRSDNLSQHMKTHQRVEDRRRRQQRNDEPMKQQHLPPLQGQQSNQQQQQQQQDNNNTMMVGMSWHNTGTVGC